MATNADIAKAAGVSPAIVSRIVNGDKTLRVTDETRARVLQTIERLDYAPNIAAKMLKSSQTGLIALVVHDLTSSVYSEIIEGAHVAAAQFGKAVLVGEAGSERDGRSHLEALLAGGGVDGLILQGAGQKTDKTLARAARLKVPTVLLQTGNPKKSAVLRLHDDAAGRTATQHLLDRGHTRIGYIGVSDDLLFSQGRQAGWASALADCDVAPQPTWFIQGGNKLPDGSDATRWLLAKAPELTAIVVANVVSAIGVLAELHDMGRKVPDDLSVIAIHDIPLAQYLRPSLSVVKMPLMHLGQQAVELVCGGETAQNIPVGQTILQSAPPIVVARESTNKVIG